jgi:geranylgeranyl pyrophosphate synthase
MSVVSKLKLSAVYHLVSNDLKRVDTFISDTLQKGAAAAELPLVDHVLTAPGKRVRPVLLMLVYYTLMEGRSIEDEQFDRVVKVAAAIELIHMASLVHDDVIDDADVRRDQASVKAKWGNPAAVAFGVYLYSISLQLIAEAGLISVLKSLSFAVKGMCEGELFQLAGREQYDLSKDEYLGVIKRKTADLFIAACESGAYVAKADSESVAAVSGFAHDLGMVFQITDDVLDILGDGEHLKKEMGQDLLEGQVTLPFIYLQEVLSQDEKGFFDDMLRSKDFDFDWIQSKLLFYKIKERVQVDILAYVSSAKEHLSECSASKYKQSLLDVLEFVARRS